MIDEINNWRNITICLKYKIIDKIKYSFKNVKMNLKKSSLSRYSPTIALHSVQKTDFI